MNSKRLNIFSSIFFFAIASFISSCSDDDKASPGSVTIDGTKSPLSKALFIYDVDPSISDVTGEDMYVNSLYLLSSGFTINGDEATGSGDAVSLEMITATATLEEGTYTFNANDLEWEPGIFSFGMVYINYNTTTELGDKFEFTAGTITVSKSGDTYTIDFEGTAGGKAATGHFVGKVITTPDL